MGHRFCPVPPSPQLRERLREELGTVSGSGPLLRPGGRIEPKAPGLNDGLIIPGHYFPLGTTIARARRTAAERAPLRGTVRVLVVLVDFPDQPAARSADDLRDLYFSQGVLEHGSVREYFAEVSGGMIDVVGEVAGPYRLERAMAAYAAGASGLGLVEPNARTMARDAALAAGPDVDFAPYDNDEDGFVDAFVVVHAGPGGEATGEGAHLWSHKWVLPGGELSMDGAKVFAYLTVPEDARIGVCAHELGHLLFGWPDLYDTDGSSEGVGDWCLMGGGSWNADGEVPAHPSAWCKAQQGWVEVVNPTENGVVAVPEVKQGRAVHRLWRCGESSEEYFLVENRQRTGFDAGLPGEGLLVWHIDDAVDSNSDEVHPKVALLQADGRSDLETARNRGDAGDAYPGERGDAVVTATSTPSSKSYGGRDTCVGIRQISPPGPVMTANVDVICAGGPGEDQETGSGEEPLVPEDTIARERLRLLVVETRERMAEALNILESMKRR